MGSSKKHEETSSVTDVQSNVNEFQQSHVDKFTSPENKQAFGNYRSRAFGNYDDVAKLTRGALNNYQTGKSLGDDSYFKQGWQGLSGVNMDGVNQLNTMSVNPNYNEDWVRAQMDIDANARRSWGNTLNQVNQNIIASGMTNGSGHQTAAYNAAAGLESQLAADKANRWQQQYNQNVQNQLAANGQLQNFYSTLSNIGLDYTKLSQQDLSTLLQAYQQQNSALNSLGQAVEMGSDPTQTSYGYQNGTQHGTQNTSSNSKSSGGFGSILGSVIGGVGSILKR